MGKIAEQLGCSKTMVAHAVRVYGDTGSIMNPLRRHPPKKTTKADDRAMVHMAKVDPFLTSNEILKQIRPRLQQTISAVTVRRRLAEFGLRGCIAKRKPLVSKTNLRKRLAFARLHVDKPITFWRRILWSDESKYNIIGSDGKMYVRRPKNRECDPRYTLKTVKHGGGSVMVWGAFSSRGVGPITRIQGKMDQYVYKDILATHMIPFCDEHMPVTAIFQHDNDPKHTSRSVKCFLQESNVEVLEWPAQSPDLNPIENLWSHVERQIRGQKCSNGHQLFHNIEQAWNNISPDVCRNLVDSMQRRCREVIKNKGYPTPY